MSNVRDKKINDNDKINNEQLITFIIQRRFWVVIWDSKRSETEVT